MLDALKNHRRYGTLVAADFSSFAAPEIMRAAHKTSFELYEEEAAKNPKFKKIYDEWKIFRAEEAQWFALTESALDQFYSSKLKI